MCRRPPCATESGPSCPTLGSLLRWCCPATARIHKGIDGASAARERDWRSGRAATRRQPESCTDSSYIDQVRPKRLARRRPTCYVPEHQDGGAPSFSTSGRQLAHLGKMERALRERSLPRDLMTSYDHMSAKKATSVLPRPWASRHARLGKMERSMCEPSLKSGHACMGGPRGGCRFCLSLGNGQHACLGKPGSILYEPSLG